MYYLIMTPADDDGLDGGLIAAIIIIIVIVPIIILIAIGIAVVYYKLKIFNSMHL